MMRSRLPLFVLLYFIVGVLLYAAATPMFESPDEASHFLYAHNLHNTGELPILEDRETVFASRAVQRHHPPLYYLFGSILLTGTTREDLPAYLQDNPFAHYGTIAANNANVLLHPLNPPPGDTMLAAWRLRLLSLLFACGTLWCIYRVGLMAFGRSIGLLAMFVTASIPSFVSISGSINNDNAVTFFYSAGIAWVVWVWQKRTIHSRDAVILGTILAGAALSKITGLTLIGFVGLVLLYGIFTGRFTSGLSSKPPKNGLSAASLRVVLRAGLIAGVCLLVLSGWWYWRNYQLYGDALALAATNRIWGRAAPTDPQRIMSEAWGVWESFWLVLGHFNVRGPNWLYPYVTAISIIGAIGVFIQFWRDAQKRAAILILFTAIAIVVGALIVATRSVNVSQGRILFPALAAFCPLLVLGLRAWGRWALLAIAPLVIVHLMTPFAILSPIFAPPRPVVALPANAIPLDAQNEWVRIVGYRIEPDRMTPDESLRVRVYIQGQHPGDPALFFKVIDPVSLVPIGGADLHPGMSALGDFDPAILYEIDVTLPIDRTRLTGRTPRRLDLFMGLRHITSADPVNEESTIPISWVKSDGTTVDFLQMPAAVLVDPDFSPPAPAHTTDVVYGQALQLVGYTVTPQELAAGEAVSITLIWSGVGEISEDWSMALGLLDASGTPIGQADGPLTGYPTSAWQKDAITEVTRTITIPTETPPGHLRLFIGWYRPTDASQRLTAQGSGIDNDLYLSPPVVTVK